MGTHLCVVSWRAVPCIEVPALGASGVSRRARAGSMSGTVTIKFIGPDLPSAFEVTVEHSSTVLQVKEAALGQWEPGDNKPTVGQLRVIHQGRFLVDEKTLKDSRIPDSELVAMHLVIKPLDTKHTEGDKAGDDKTPKCTCTIC